MVPDLKTLLENGEVLEIRGDGKAGSGLLMAMQTFGIALGRERGLQVHEWPLFSSARKGANVRSYMRVASHPINMSASITKPHLAILVDESVAESLDFASGMKEGVFVVNTARSAEKTAKQYRLSGITATIDGDRLGEKYLGHRIGNISVFAALIQVTDLMTPEEGRKTLEGMMKKRRLPEKIVKANLECFDESLKSIDIARVEGDSDWSHETKQFEKFPFLPIAAQSALRTSLKNKTSLYRPSGMKLLFADPTDRCSGCALCLTNCPENIITFVPDEKRGLKVTGANVVDFCKLCEECVEVCPVELFKVEEEEARC